MGKNAVSRSFAKKVPERVYTRRKGLLLAATSLINFLGLTRYRVKSIAPTRLSRMSPLTGLRHLLTGPDFVAGGQTSQEYRTLTPFFTKTRLAERIISEKMDSVNTFFWIF